MTDERAVKRAVKAASLGNAMEWFDFGVYAYLAGTMSAALPAMFPTPVRYGSLSVGYNLSASLFGGTTPLVITALIGATGSDMMPAYYAMAAALVGVVAVACMKETARQPLEGSPPSVQTEQEAAELVRSQAPTPKF